MAGGGSMSHYKPYPAYKDSGVEWIGDVPEGWKRRKIAHAFEVVGSGTTPPTGQHEWYSNSGIPWITTGELRESVITKTSKYVTAKALEEFSTLRLYPAGSLAMAMYGATIGRLGILGVQATTNQACCVLSGGVSLHIRFVYFWLLAFKQPIIDLFAVGGGQPNINQEVIANLRVPAPNLGGQEAIAIFLDRETTCIDALIAKKTRFIELLKEKRSALITHAVTKGLDPNVKMKDSGVEWIGEVPEGWMLMAFKRVALICNGRDYKDVEDLEGAYPVFGSGGEFARASSFMFNGESVLLGRKGTIDKPLYINGPFWAVDTMFYTKIAEDAFPKFVYYAALNIPFDRYSTNTALPSMTGENLSSHVIVAPKLDEQTAIAKFLDRETARIDALIAKVKRGINLLKEHRSALITAAVTGKIDVREICHE